MKLHRVTEKIEAKTCNLSGSTFDDVNLRGTTIENVNLSDCHANNVNLSRLTITDANLSHASIAESCLHGMTINGIPVDDLLATYAASKAGS